MPDSETTVVSQPLEQQVVTLRWQLQTLAHALTMSDCVLERFIILRDVTEAEFDRLNDVLEECDGIIKREDPARRGIDWDAVERQFLEILPGRKDLTLWEVMISFHDGGIDAPGGHAVADKMTFDCRISFRKY